MKNISQQWSHNWATDRAVFVTVSDSHYFYFVQNLMDSIITFNYTAEDMVVGCSSSACYHRCQPLGYECLLYENPVCNNQTRCLVGDAKIETMLYALDKGYVAIFVDLDVFIRKDPLIPFQPEDPYSIVCMFDIHPYLNFGLFVARPDDYTLGLFRWMKLEFHVKEENDQVLFNRYIQKEHVPVQVTPLCLSVHIYPFLLIFGSSTHVVFVCVCCSPLSLFLSYLHPCFSYLRVHL